MSVLTAHTRAAITMTTNITVKLTVRPTAALDMPVDAARLSRVGRPEGKPVGEVGALEGCPEGHVGTEVG